MESFLRLGQEKNLVATSRALASALHDRPKLFDSQASFLDAVEKGRTCMHTILLVPFNLMANSMIGPLLTTSLVLW